MFSLLNQFLSFISAYRRLQQQRMQKSDQRVRLEKIRQKLKERLSLNNIFNEIQLIGNMNKHLEIKLNRMKSIDLLSRLAKEEVLQILQGIPFLKVFRKNSNQQEIVRIQYENANKLLLVTGIQKPFVEQMVSKFNNMSRRQFYPEMGKPSSAKIVNNNFFWNTIQTSSQEAAAALKKYLRNQKKYFDQDITKNNYKIERRRIRIIIVKEDLFTLLIDAMTQLKTQMFLQNFILLPTQLLQRRKSQQLSTLRVQSNKTVILYRPLLYNNLQSYSAKNEQKEEEFSDGFSQSNSLNSEIIDASKMKDLIQTSDQGIQSQNNIQTTAENVFINAHPQILSSHSQREIIQYNQQVKNDQILLQQNQRQLEPKQKTQIALSDLQKVQMNELEAIENKTRLQVERQDSICTQKHSPIYKKVQSGQKLEAVSGQSKQSCSQTDEALYTVISNALMRRLMQQFKNRNHSQLIQFPEWMKSESQNQRNRHRFFSSLCKPKLIRQRKIQ